MASVTGAIHTSCFTAKRYSWTLVSAVVGDISLYSAETGKLTSNFNFFEPTSQILRTELLGSEKGTSLIIGRCTRSAGTAKCELKSQTGRRPTYPRLRSERTTSLHTGA